MFEAITNSPITSMLTAVFLVGVAFSDCQVTLIIALLCLAVGSNGAIYRDVRNAIVTRLRED